MRVGVASPPLAAQGEIATGALVQSEVEPTVGATARVARGPAADILPSLKTPITVFGRPSLVGARPVGTLGEAWSGARR
jgi:hypothetical protein